MFFYNSEKSHYLIFIKILFFKKYHKFSLKTFIVVIIREFNVKKFIIIKKKQLS